MSKDTNTLLMVAGAGIGLYLLSRRTGDDEEGALIPGFDVPGIDLSSFLEGLALPNVNITMPGITLPGITFFGGGNGDGGNGNGEGEGGGGGESIVEKVLEFTGLDEPVNEFQNSWTTFVQFLSSVAAYPRLVWEGFVETYSATLGQPLHPLLDVNKLLGFWTSPVFGGKASASSEPTMSYKVAPQIPTPGRWSYQQAITYRLVPSIPTPGRRYYQEAITYKVAPQIPGPGRRYYQESTR